MAGLLDLLPPVLLDYGADFSFEVVKRNRHGLDDDSDSYENGCRQQSVYIFRKS